VRALAISLLAAAALSQPALSQEDCDNACLVGYESSLFVSDDCHVTPSQAPEYPLHTDGGASCETSFLLNEDGVPYDIQAECTDPAFARSAERFAAGLRYDVTNSAGNACFRPGANRWGYPIEYRLAGD